MEYIHQAQKALTFTSKWDKHSIDFLDFTIKHEDGRLITTLYRKSTDKNSLLVYHSFHPHALRDGLPFGQFLRIRRNCTKREDYFREAHFLRDRLAKRAYPKREIRRALKRAWYNPRDEILKKKEKVPNPRTVCVMTFNPNTNRVTNIIKRHWKLISHLGDLKEPPFLPIRKVKISGTIWLGLPIL